MRYAVLPMRREDVSQVHQIEKEANLASWPANVFERELDNPRARYLVAVGLDAATGEPLPAPPPTESTSAVGRLLAGVRSLIAPPSVSGGRLILGYVGMWMLFDEAHITTLAVRQPYRRRGVGELLMLAAITAAQDLGMETVTLETRVSNLAAQALYHKCDFHQTGLRRAYYSDNQEDALLMATDRITSATYHSHLALLKRLHRERWNPDGRDAGRGAV